LVLLKSFDRFIWKACVSMKELKKLQRFERSTKQGMEPQKKVEELQTCVPMTSCFDFHQKKLMPLRMSRQWFDYMVKDIFKMW
ncbi:unnamed protein product, partial [Durusdinium trenchii]